MNRFHLYIIPLTSNSLYFVKKFRELGITLVGLDDNEANGHKGEVDFFLKIDPSQIQDLEKKLTLKKSRSLGLFALNSDFGMKKSTEISRKINLKNNFSVLDNEWLYDKFFYLKKLNKINTVYLPSEINPGSDKFDYIVKPRFGSGSRQVSYYNRSDTSKLFKDEFIFQRKLEGREYSIDGFNYNGTPSVFTISKRRVDKFSATLIVSLKNNSQLYNKIEDYILSKSDLFPDNTVFPFHIELINDAMFGFQIIDFSPRGGGFSLGDRFIETTTGLNIHEIYLNFFKNTVIPNFPKIRYRYSLIYFIKFEKGVFQSLSFDNDLLTENDKYFSLISRNTKMVDPTNDSHRIGFFILSSNLKRDLDVKFTTLKKSINIKKK